MNTELKQFAKEVEQMRLAQGRYFEISGKAKKTKDPSDYKMAKYVLQLSKELEIQVDQRVKEIKSDVPISTSAVMQHAICERCGTVNDPGARFCVSCKNEIKKAEI